MDLEVTLTSQEAGQQLLDPSQLQEAGLDGFSVMKMNAQQVVLLPVLHGAVIQQQLDQDRLEAMEDLVLIV
uniref:Ubiquitin-like domain-containing protein n=1 Tax=Heterorhabditis bacteriophora TaxID=37862 RepID=A0A1I7XPK3_HETBA